MNTVTITLTEAEVKCLRQMLGQYQTFMENSGVSQAGDSIEDAEYFISKLN